VPPDIAAGLHRGAGGGAAYAFDYDYVLDRGRLAQGFIGGGF
jgi:hypothetical protein